MILSIREITNVNSAKLALAEFHQGVFIIIRIINNNI